MKKSAYRILGILLAVVMLSASMPMGAFAATAVKVSTITLSKTSATLTVGKMVLLTASVKPDNATNRSVTWSSSAKTVAAPVLSTGLIVALSIGSAVITCTARDGSGVTATCKITVVPDTPGSFTVVRASSTSVLVSWKAVLGVTGYEVQRYSPLLKTFVPVKITTSTSFLNSGLLSGRTYTYRVRAFKIVGTAVYSSAFTDQKTA